jgi:methionine-rich copper-binding protein CopC
MRKALVAVLLGSLALLVSPTPAFAHAELVTSSPRNGSQLLLAPRNITLTFGEDVALDTAQILDQSAVVVPATAVLSGSRLTVTPSEKLANGRYAVSWQVTSEDGHVVAGAIAFTIKVANPPGQPTTLALLPAIKARISSPQVGARTITFASKAKSGEVLLTNDALPGPITWRVTGNGKLAKASGVIPFAGTWAIEASLFAGALDFVVAKGTQTFR